MHTVSGQRILAGGERCLRVQGRVHGARWRRVHTVCCPFALAGRRRRMCLRRWIHRRRPRSVRRVRRRHVQERHGRRRVQLVRPREGFGRRGCRVRHLCVLPGQHLPGRRGRERLLVVPRVLSGGAVPGQLRVCSRILGIRERPVHTVFREHLQVTRWSGAVPVLANGLQEACGQRASFVQRRVHQVRRHFVLALRRRPLQKHRRQCGVHAVPYRDIHGRRGRDPRGPMPAVFGIQLVCTTGRRRDQPVRTCTRQPRPNTGFDLSLEQRVENGK